MTQPTALRVAIDLMLVPSRVRLLKREGLPEGVPFLLRIAAGDAEAIQDASELTRKPPNTIEAAAAFFIEQILFAPESDSYRVLGAGQNATAAELRNNLGLLFKWLHADSGQSSERLIFVRRLTDAWNELKTPERRSAYDIAKKNREAEEQIRRDSRRNAPSAAPCKKENALSGNAVNSRKERHPPRTRSARWPKPRGLLGRAFLFVFGRREH